MNYLSAENVGKNFGERVLFQNLSFGLAKNDKIALIAANGTGKTSLLRILAGKDSPSEGQVALRDGIKIALLEQEPEMNPSLTIREIISDNTLRIVNIISEYNKALTDHSHSSSSQNLAHLNKWTTMMDHYEGWDFERRMMEMLNRFNIFNPDQKIGSLSGGQRKRLALSMVLIDKPDILLLDEPTNHLDINMIEWLENYLSQPGITFLMVTHDRYFLDRICRQIFEISYRELFIHNGNFEYFLRKKEERLNTFQTETDRASKFVRHETEWINRMPKARTGKSKSRIDAYYKTRERASVRRNEKDINLNINMQRLGDKILEIKNISKSFGSISLLSGFNYTFSKGERLGIIGGNGSGKTSFLNLITGRLESDSGSIVTGETIAYGYFTQEGISLQEDKRVIEVVTDIAEVIETAPGSRLSASQFLQFFLFPPEMQYTFVSKLSGGEKRRLHLLTVLMKNPNFLILDEPTNDLDILTLERLEEFLSGFGGCLILVSHDRYFLDRLVDHLFIFEGNGKVRDYYGNYSDYKMELDKQAEETKNTASNSSASQPSMVNRSGDPKKLSFNEKREYKALGSEIENLEMEKKKLEGILSSGENDYQKLDNASQRIGEIMRLIDEKAERWMELDERNQD